MKIEQSPSIKPNLSIISLAEKTSLEAAEFVNIISEKNIESTEMLETALNSKHNLKQKVDINKVQGREDINKDVLLMDPNGIPKYGSKEKIFEWILENKGLFCYALLMDRCGSCTKVFILISSGFASSGNLEDATQISFKFAPSLFLNSSRFY